MASIAVFLRSRHRSLFRLSASDSSSPFHLFSLASSFYSSRRPFSFSHGASSAFDEPSARPTEAARHASTPLPSMEGLRSGVPTAQYGKKWEFHDWESWNASRSKWESCSEGRRKSLRWTDEMNRVLLDALLRQLNMGNRGTVRFKTSAIDEVVEEIRSKMKVDSIERVKVHAHLQRLRRNFVEVYDAFKGLSGFRWNPITMLIEADEEQWNDLIKSNPKAAQWRKKPIPHYDKLKEMWGKDRDTDEQTLSTKGIAQEGSSSSSQTDDEQETAIEARTDESKDFRRGESTSLKREKDDEQETAIEARTDESGDFRTSLRREGDDALVTVVSEIGKSLERVADVLAKSLHRVYSSEEIYAEMERLEIDGGTKFHAVEVLTKEECLARVLFGIPAQERRAWLLRRLHARK